MASISAGLKRKPSVISAAQTARHKRKAVLTAVFICPMRLAPNSRAVTTEAPMLSPTAKDR